MRSIRSSRSWHRYLGLGLALLLLVSAVTGLLLGWKKQSEWLQPVTQRGTAGAFEAWLPMSVLADSATAAFAKTAGADTGPEIDRMDARPGKNTVKVRFAHDDYEVQVDAITGRVLNVGKRNADWIERIHDGSIVSQPFKLVSMNALSVGLVLLIASGTWLWYGPRRYRKVRRGKGEGERVKGEGAGGDAT